MRNRRRDSQGPRWQACGAPCLDVMRIWDLPRERMRGGDLERTAIRSKGSLVTFNLFQPGMEMAPPHSHPFDQLVIIISGHFRMYVESIAYDMPAGSALLIPAGHAHSGYPVGGEQVVNIDVFAPVRNDYLHLVEHQNFRKVSRKDEKESRPAPDRGRTAKCKSDKPKPGQGNE